MSVIFFGSPAPSAGIDVDLLAAGLVGDEGEELAVGRVGDVLVADRAVGDLPELAVLVRRRGEDPAVDREGDPLAVGGDVVVVDRRVEVAELDQALLGLGGDVEVERGDGLGREVELADAEVALEDDRLAVGGDRREADVAVA